MPGFCDLTPVNRRSNRSENGQVRSFGNQTELISVETKSHRIISLAYPFVHGEIETQLQLLTGVELYLFRSGIRSYDFRWCLDHEPA